MDWQRAYAEATTPWDLRQMTPPLVRLLDSGRLRDLGLPDRARVAVPACGRGHDVRAWAWAGHDVTGFDVVPEVVAEARELLRLNRAFGPQVLCRDVLGIGDEFTSAFDVVYDYTCFCALPPYSRARYAREMARVLRPRGLWVALAFPLDARIGHPDRPPYAIGAHAIADALADHFEPVASFEAEDSVPARRGAERWEIWTTVQRIDERAGA